MWARLKRLFRSIFGGLIESAEDPELILQQTIRDMREKVPQMQNNVVQVMAMRKLPEEGAIRAQIKLRCSDTAHHRTRRHRSNYSPPSGKQTA